MIGLFVEWHAPAEDKYVTGGYCPDDLRELALIVQRSHIPFGIALG
jgi:hypothetical protein